MKKFLAFVLGLIMFLPICGCDMSSKYPPLPDTPIAFKPETYIDKNDDDAAYSVIEYNGRKYAPYGTSNGKCRTPKMVDKCLGYFAQDDDYDENINTRVFTVLDDENNNFLMVHYVVNNLMNPPTFYRAVDTFGEDIHIPYFIENLNYNMWKNSND